MCKNTSVTPSYYIFIPKPCDCLADILYIFACTSNYEIPFLDLCQLLSQRFIYK